MQNVLEGEIRVLYEGLRRKHAEFCDCARCQSDVVTLALNNIRPRYVSGQVLGGAVTRASLADTGERAAVLVIVYDAMRQVSQRPNHDGAPEPSAGT
jgi:competence protein ComFB